METNQAKEIIERIRQEKQDFLQGGSKDFQGALKRLVGIWGNPSHALIELLQNADDAEATAVEYKILPNGILFNHNGHSFTECEVKAICSIDDSTKDAENHTGFMGIGFKAVFKLSNSPFVFCPPWQFRFSPDGLLLNDWGWILIPRWIDSVPPEINGVPEGKTVFWLPYKEELSEDAIKRIEGEIFERFDSLCLMFLRNITQIQIESSDGRTRKLHHEEDDTVIEEKNGKKTAHRYKVFRKLFEVPDEAKVEYLVQDSGRDQARVREIVLAFALEKGNLQPMTNSPLYTFLPTDYFPGLRFAVQGDFILDTQRSRVDESLKWNRWLWRCVKNLLQGAIEGFIDDNGNTVKGFKENEPMRHQFYRMLPSKKDFSSISDQSVIRTELIKPFWNYCRENPIIATSDNAWVKPSEAVLASQDVQNLLDTKKLKELMGREHFVHPEVQEVKEFLNEIGVADLPEQKILAALKDKDWVNSKEDGWFSDLYAFLWDRLADEKKWKNEWWREESQVKSLPIVRTSQRVAKKPDEVLFPPENEKEIELATGMPDVLFVEKLFLEGNARKLLEKLGVQTFNRESIVKTVILKGFEDGTWQNWTKEQRDRCVQFIREWLKEQGWKPPTELQRRIGAVRVRTESDRLECANKCYFLEQELKRLCPEGNFVRLDDGDEDQLCFLHALGVKDRPRLFIKDGQYEQNKGPESASRWGDYWSWLEKKNHLAYSTGHRKVSNVSYLDTVQVSSEVAIIILGYFVKYWQSDYKSYVESRYEFFYYSSQKKTSAVVFCLPTIRNRMAPNDQRAYETIR